MKQNNSSRRVNEQARQVIAETLMFEISDPRLRMVTVTGCEVSFDRSACNVYYTTSPDLYEETQEAFAKAKGHIRSVLAKKLSWRTSPELRFFVDKTVDEAERIARALEVERSRSGVNASEESE
ncbi:MAG: 30S ribosome-binding factor RbfA [Eggerthellaceae bacterium]|nr:30S ribosome-binding factor RbfA [Eggerthellaceae bacterium]